MAARPVWKGFIRFSLVTIPVKAYTAAVTGGGDVHLHFLHKTCHSRIRYKKVCPIHGEVSADQIVSGYEFAKGQYVVIDPQELQDLRAPSEKALNIAAFIKPETIDPRYFSGRTNYLVPDSAVGRKPFALLRRVMEDQGQNAFAQVVMNGRDHIVLLRPLDHLLAMNFLTFAADLKKPADFDDEAGNPALPEKELAMARTLTKALASDKFDIDAYKDHYEENLRALIQAKIEGKKVVAPAAGEEPKVINLMDALQKSLEQAKSGRPPAGKPAKPSKLVAPGTAGKKEIRRKRKSS